MDRPPSSCWFAAIPGAQKAKDVEDCLNNTAAPPLNSIDGFTRGIYRLIMPFMLGLQPGLYNSINHFIRASNKVS